MASNLPTSAISQFGNVASVVDSVEDPVSDDEVGGTPLKDTYSLSGDDDGDLDNDDIPLEDDIPAIVELPNASADESVPREPAQPKEPARSRLRSLPSMHLPSVRQIFNWIVGCNLAIDEEYPSKNANMNRTSPNKEDEGSRPPPPLVENDFIDIGDVQDFCPACSTPYCQALDSLPFRSSLRLYDNDPETHTWYIGDKYIMKETVDHEPPAEAEEVTLVKATQVIRRVTRVPVPTVIAGWREQGKVITIAEQVPGKRLYDIWWDLEDDEKERLAREVARHIDQWRRLSGDLICNLSGGPVRHHDKLFGARPEGFGPFGSDGQFWNAIHRCLRDKEIDDEVIQVLLDYMPESGPCVLTHGDLSCANILVHEGRVSAILGFDNAACLPVWAENVAVHFCACREDEQWKAMLSRHMKSYARALDWWSLWRAVEDARAEIQTKIPTLIARCRRWQKPPVKKRSFKKGADSSDDENEKAQRVAYAYQQMMMPEPLQRAASISSRRNGFVVLREQEGEGSFAAGGHPPGWKRPSSFRTELRKKLMQGKQFSELLNHPFWELPIDSQSSSEYDDNDKETIDHRRTRASLAPRTQRKSDRISFEQARRKFEEAGTKDEADLDKLSRPNFDRWLQASTGSGRSRGKAVPRPRGTPGAGLPEHRATHHRDTDLTEDPTLLVKEPSWREKRRSFEGSQEPPRGLRPLSLSSHAVSPESLQAKLRGTETDGANAGTDADASREQTFEETLRSLESGWREDGPRPGPSGNGSGSGEPPATKRKRVSILRDGKKVAPGSLFSAIVKASAEKGARKPRRSRSEERLSDMIGEEDQDPEPGHLRPRPRSTMPPPSDRARTGG
ncbi:hypothetical protein F4779DRAFT_620830 [Xylariaceae sp. FL0662B]|nr:hypothetical protein F4779DRAFT_620830 [Xylariaceae sp. FL0662B]